MFYSLDGQVKLFDLRGPDFAATTWDLLPKSLSAFDVHPISGVFAAYVISLTAIFWKLCGR